MICDVKGLTTEQAEQSRMKYGQNVLTKRKLKTIFQMFFDACKDFWVEVLFATLVFKLVMIGIGHFYPAFAADMGDVYEIIGIVIAIVLSTGFSTISEFRNTTRSEALQAEYNKTYAKVMRDGKLCSILTSEIVKGDVILIQAGDKIPVDGLIVSGFLKVSQAVLNGESEDVKKVAATDFEEAETNNHESSVKVFMGSVVNSGEAYMVATVIGDATELGLINLAMQESEEEEREDTSSLKLKRVANGIGKLGATAAGIAAALNVILTLLRADSGVITGVFIGMLIAESLMLLASIIIMAVPEGLPMMTSLVQAMNTESLYKKHILVSHKAAFADAAYVNILFSDKTGTITEGKLSLVEFITGVGQITHKLATESTDFVKAITLNNQAKVSSDGTAIGSNNMDRALLTYALEQGYQDGNNASDDVAEFSGFDSEKKCATTTMKNGTVYWKGATETILDNVTHFIDENGAEVPFTEKHKATVLASMECQMKRMMKLLSVAKCYDGKVVLYGVLCFRDNVRKDAIETVHTLNQAGIQVVMVTGDAEDTAIAIAKEAGILTSDSDVILTHEELQAMSDEDVKEQLPNLRVVSRAKPLDKKRLVQLAQSLEDVCAMTGKLHCPVML